MRKSILHNIARVSFLAPVLFALSLFISELAIAEIQPAAITPEAGQTYFTRYNFWVEKEKSAATNYARGELIPFNTQATLESVGKKKIVLNVDGRKLTIVNVRKHTQRDSAEIAAELLSPGKLSLGGIPTERRNDMESGILRLGMDKEQALITRGYPPRHKTPSTKANAWVYWSSRFVQQTVVFEDGKLTRGRGLY